MKGSIPSKRPVPSPAPRVPRTSHVEDGATATSVMDVFNTYRQRVNAGGDWAANAPFSTALAHYGDDYVVSTDRTVHDGHAIVGDREFAIVTTAETAQVLLRAQERQTENGDRLYTFPAYSDVDGAGIAVQVSQDGDGAETVRYGTVDSNGVFTASTDRFNNYVARTVEDGQCPSIAYLDSSVEDWQRSIHQSQDGSVDFLHLTMVCEERVSEARDFYGF